MDIVKDYITTQVLGMLSMGVVYLLMAVVAVNEAAGVSLGLALGDLGGVAGGAGKMEQLLNTKILPNMIF